MFPVWYSIGLSNVPSPLPKRIEVEFESRFAVAISRFPSKLKSTIITDNGNPVFSRLECVSKFIGELNVASPFPR